MNDQKIYYKRARDFGGIFGASFSFIKQNFKTLYGSLFFYAGPFLLIAATVSAYMMGSSLGMSRLFKSGNIAAFYADFIGSYIITMLAALVGITIFNVILNRNLIENEKLLAGQPLTLRHTILNFWPDFGRVLGNSLLLGIVLVISLTIIILVFAGMFALFGVSGGGAQTIIASVLGILALLFFSLVFGPILAFIPMSALFIVQRDNIGIFPALGKIFHYMKNNFWMTWAVSFVGLLVYIAMAFVVQIPLAIVSFITTFSRVKSTVGYGIEDDSTPLLLVIVTVISSLLSYAIMVIYHLICVYQYTSLEEKKEGSSIIEKISQIQ